MCGLAGIFNLNQQNPPAESVIREMLGALRHRGPDEFGYYLDDRIAIGNARLSIIDLDGGQQPIATPDQRYYIVFNGEIFNYLELRQELIAQGHHFSTRTDTEVLLRLFVALGPRGFNRLNGQFAAAIYDTQEEVLILVRDRLGVRPLYYTVTNGSLIFASEIKAIACHPLVSLEIDPLGMNQVFSRWSTTAPRTIFRGIEELPPGTFLTTKDHNLHLEKYWQLNFSQTAPSPAPSALRSALPAPSSLLRALSSELPAPSSELYAPSYLDEFRSLLIDAVRIRLRADVPVGAYLSGGLDSSVISYIIRNYGPARLDTFSIAFNDEAFDESAYQTQMAQFLGTDHHVVHATYTEIGAAFPEVVWHCETPMLRTAPAPMFLLSRQVRELRYKVVLTGEGADEFLAGYDIFKETAIRRFWARQPSSKCRPLLLQRLYPDIAQLAKTGPGFLVAFFREGLSDVDRAEYSHLVRWRTTRRSQRFFSDALLDNITQTAVQEPIECPTDFGNWGALERAQYLEIATFLSSYLLSSQGDRMAMAHSVEGRYPFLDHRVVEFCSRLPSQLKLRGLRDKRLLRQVARDWLPREICERRKRPYRAPIHRCFFGKGAPQYVRDVLSENAIIKAGLFRADAVQRLIRKVEAGVTLGETDDMALAGIISSQLLHHQFVENRRSASPLTDKDKIKICRKPLVPADNADSRRLKTFAT
jgi:asparagine synthase (glutamine-hydrolysing)